MNQSHLASAAAQIAIAGIPMPRIGEPLADGIFRGIVAASTPDEPDQALVDLGFPFDRKMNHADALKAVAAMGASLPTRADGRILHGNGDIRSKESRGWFWLQEQYEAGSVSAWFQGFGDGDQGTGRKVHEFAVRAVRRLPLLPFTNSTVRGGA